MKLEKLAKVITRIVAPLYYLVKDKDKLYGGIPDEFIIIDYTDQMDDYFYIKEDETKAFFMPHCTLTALDINKFKLAIESAVKIGKLLDYPIARTVIFKGRRMYMMVGNIAAFLYSIGSPVVDPGYYYREKPENGEQKMRYVMKYETLENIKRLLSLRMYHAGISIHGEYFCLLLSDGTITVRYVVKEDPSWVGLVDQEHVAPDGFRICPED